MKKNPPLYDDVLGYIAYMPFVATTDEILSLLKSHGRKLSRHRASVFAALLVKLCTGDYASLLPSSHPVVQAAKAEAASVRGREVSKGSKSVTPADVLRSFTHLLSSDVQIPTERLPITEIMYLFVTDEVNLLVLLEGFVEGSPGRILPAKVTTTLMELYLANYHNHFKQLFTLKNQLDASKGAIEDAESALQAVETQVMGLMDGAHVQYDPAHALLLCHSFNFDRGLRFLLERQQSIELLMRMLLEGNDVKEIFKVLRREGPKDPELYIKVLTHFVVESIDVAEEVEGVKSAKLRRQSSGSIASDDSEGDEEEDDEER